MKPPDSESKPQTSASGSDLESLLYVSANNQVNGNSEFASNGQTHVTSHAARFGPFELSMDTGELRKHGVRVRLQHRPFQVLAALLDRPGRLVTREELRTKLWASDVFVDFESGLNTAVNRLRLALGDSAESPMYIETLSRLGYRFLAPVQVLLEQPQQTPAPMENIAPTQAPDLPDPGIVLEMPRSRPHRSRTVLWTVASTLILVAITTGVLLRFARHPASYQQLTFRKGFVSNARFTPGGKQIVYSAEWNGAPSGLFLMSTDGRESRDLHLSSASLEAISSSKGSNVLLKRMDGNVVRIEAASLNGGPPRLLAERVRSADWGPDGKLCLVTAKGSRFTIQYPAGHILYESSAWIEDVRVSRDGRRVAFAQHPILHDDGGQVVMVDAMTGQSRILSPGWESLDGLAWSPSGSEIWFTAAHAGVERSLMAVTLDGRTRLVAQTPGGMQLRDIAQSGEVLVNRSNEHLSMLSGTLPEASQQNISWLDWSRPAAISEDGETILFDESGAGGGTAYSVFVYRHHSPSPERIGSGRAMDLSNDGRWALAQDAADPAKLSLLSVDERTSQRISGHGFIYRWSKFLPDARQILIAGNFRGQPAGIYRQQLPDGVPVLVNSGIQLDEPVIDTTGRFAAAVSDQCEVTILDLSNGHTRTIKTGRMVYPVVFMNATQVVTRAVENKTVVLDLLDLESGESRPLHRIQPADNTGIAYIFPIQIARNLRTYVYSRLESYSDLFIVSGLR